MARDLAARQSFMGQSASSALLALLALLAASSFCQRESPGDRRARLQRAMRDRRLARARRLRALRRAEEAARARYYREIQKALHAPAPVGSVGPPHRSVSLPLDSIGQVRRATACRALARLAERLEAHAPLWEPAATHVLSSISSELVQLGARTYQRFAFVVRMHPADEPRLGRPAARPELVLRLTWRPLCPEQRLGELGADTIAKQVHLPLVRRPRARGQRARARAIFVRRNGANKRPVPVGSPVEILMESSPLPVRTSHRHGQILRGRVTPSPSPALSSAHPSSPSVGLWRLVDAHFAGRRRLARLHLDTYSFGGRLTRLAAVEVACPAPGRRCRFLTRSTAGGLERRISIEALARRAAPVRTSIQAEQLFDILRSLRYFRCISSGREASPVLFSHPCLHPGKPFSSPACLYYRAINGYRTKRTMVHRHGQWIVRQTLRCELPSGLRILSVEARFGPGDALHLRETDLSARATFLEDQVRKLRQRSAK